MKSHEDLHVFCFYIVCSIPFIWIIHAVFTDTKKGEYSNKEEFKKWCGVIFYSLIYFLIVYYFGDKDSPVLYGLISTGIACVFAYCFIQNTIQKRCDEENKKEREKESKKQFNEMLEIEKMIKKSKNI